MKSDLNNPVFEVDGSIGLNEIINVLQKSWNNYSIYHIYNVEETDYEKFYEDLASKLGTIQDCRPVNSKDKAFSKTRDIKHDPSDYHFYAANTRQPLHTDHAYYPENKSPDWAMLYCLDKSEFGGSTRFLTSSKLVKILEKYNPNLLSKLSTDVKWQYIGEDENEFHCKPILVGERINWNYWQIKKDLNNKEVIKIADEFFEFLEEVIEDGNIFDVSKVWARGDAVICNDKKVLHGRDAFLGNDRWLKYHAFYNNK